LSRSLLMTWGTVWALKLAINAGVMTRATASPYRPPAACPSSYASECVECTGRSE
jgi:hypothetical protein